MKSFLARSACGLAPAAVPAFRVASSHAAATQETAREGVPPKVANRAPGFLRGYRLIAHIPVESPARRADLLNPLHGNLQEVFNEHGVRILSPQYMMDAKAPQVVPGSRWCAAPAGPPGETMKGAKT